MSDQSNVMKKAFSAVCAVSIESVEACNTRRHLDADVQTVCTDGRTLSKLFCITNQCHGY